MFFIKHKKIIAILILGLMLPGLSLATNTLPGEVVEVLNKHKLPKDSLSVYIKQIHARDPILAYQINTPRNPASVMKMVTTLAALDLFGPNYQWQTKFYIRGEIKEGDLNGDLIIKGGGDPFFVRENLWHALHSLREKGIKNINGNLIIDNSLYARETGHTGHFDNRPYRAYNAFPDSALFNFNSQYFIFLPKDKTVHIYADPPSNNLTIINKVKLTKGKCKGIRPIKMDVSHNGQKSTVEFNGNYASSCGEKNLLRSVSNHTHFTFGAFKALWQNMGGKIKGSVKNGLVPANAELFHVVLSKPLREIIHYINKYSNNVMARQLMLTIGEKKNGKPGTKQTGELAIKQWLRQIGIPAKELVIENGSGLSRKSRISALSLARMLEHGYRSLYQPEFFSSLPIAGIDGTMRKRFRKEIPGGAIRMKTGLLNDVRSMAGYVTAKSGKRYIVVSMQNYKGVQNWTGTEVQNALLIWLYNNY